MTQRKKLGNWGETIAIKYLRQKGLTILETNWRFKRGEVDILARHEGELVVVEVKTRSGNYFGQPEDSVDEHKQTLLADCAWAYLEEKNLDLPVRFDIISILFDDQENHSIHHIEDAFFPMDEGPTELDENF